MTSLTQIITPLHQDFRYEVFFTHMRVVHMLNGYLVRFGKHLCIITNFVAQRIGKLLGVIEYLDRVSIEITRRVTGITNPR